MPKPLNLIVACSENRVIGRNRKLPFDIPEDKSWFDEKTAGCVVILGRIGFEVWPGALAHGRQPVVITSQPEPNFRGAERTAHPPDGIVRPRIARSVPAALALAETLSGPIMICGGERIYQETLPLVDRLFLTLVHAEVSGDTFFPEWRHLSWRETWRRESSDTNHRYTFSVLERNWPAAGPVS